MFGREAILPLDAALKLETSAFPGSAKTYPGYVVQQKLQVEVTEQLVRENLKRAQKAQKAHYDTKCYGQRFHAGDRVWYRNRTRVRKKKFLKPWCGPWKVIKALSGVTYRIEEEKRKPGRRRQRRVVHFNYLKPCHSSPQEILSPSSRELSGQPDAREVAGVLIPVSQDADVPDSPVAENPHQPETPVESSSPVAEQSQRPRRERREPPWLRYNVRTVVC
ncbi:hypothetical protein ACROYT_G023988 [Oculina patagonica]